MWVAAYRHSRNLFARTNNGVERMNDHFKGKFLHRRANNTLSYLLRIIVECFVPTVVQV